MVERCNEAVAHLLHPVTVNTQVVLQTYGAVGRVGLGIGFLLQVVAYHGGCLTLSRRIDQQVLGQVDIHQTRQAAVVEQWWIEHTVVVGIAACEVDGSHILVGLDGGLVLLALCKDSIRVEVGRLHGAAAIVGWCTEHAVALCRCLHQITLLDDMRRQLLVGQVLEMVVVQRLTEEQIVVGPDRRVCPARLGIAFIHVVGYRAVGIDEVTIAETSPNVWVVDGLATCPVAVVTVFQIEAVEVVGHLTVVERLLGHLRGIAARMTGFAIGVACGIVAVDELRSLAT